MNRPEDLDKDCVFCKFINGMIDRKRIVYQDDYVLAFKEEKAPMAAFHVLIIPKAHIESVSKIISSNSYYIKFVYEAAAKIAKANLIDSYSVFTRTGAHAGQTVSHLHYHMISNFQDDCILRV